MRFRVRSSTTRTRPRLLWILVFSILLNFVVAYACDWRATLMGFSASDGAYGDWDHWVEDKDEKGWQTSGHTLGVYSWIDERLTPDPPENWSPEYGISAKGGTVLYVRTSGTRVGFPLKCVQRSEEWHEVVTFGLEIENHRRSITKLTTDQTPTPHWYYKGIDISAITTKLWAIPVQIRPLHLLINILFYFGLLWSTRLLVHSLRCRRRYRLGLCTACGYALKDHAICPECGVGIHKNHESRGMHRLSDA